MPASTASTTPHRAGVGTGGPVDPTRPLEHEVDLAITGMTCASCSSRIERKLNRLEHVEASVNLATERASVRFAAPVTRGEIVAAVERTGYGATVIEPEADGSPRVTHDVLAQDTLRRRLVVAVVLCIPLLVVAMGPWSHEAWSPWLQLALATPVVAWAAWPFHRAAALNARHGTSTMDTLVSIGVLASYLWSLGAVVGYAVQPTSGGHPHLYFETAGVITTFLLLGRWLESRARRTGAEALTTLLTLGAKDVAVQRIDSRTRATTEVRIPIGQLRVGDHFVVRPGEKIATDGLVLDGSSAIDSSLVTGEADPVDVRAGDEVVGGTLNAQGRLVVQAQRVGEETMLAGIARLVERAQTGKAGIEHLADRVSAVFVPLVLVLAALTFVGWLVATHDPARALSVAVTVLVIACPCALGLAAPAAILAGTGRGAQLGILITGPQVLEDTRRIDTVVLDKTGTLTSGVARLMEVTPAGRLTATAALQSAAAVESGSEHPIGRAIVRAARERGIVIPAVTDFRAMPGAGALATIKGTEVTVGAAELFAHVPPEIAGHRSSGTTVYVGWGDRARAALTVADEVRPTSREAVRRLTEQGLEVHLLTGDHEAAARAVGAQVGIPAERVVAGVKPAQKHAVIEHLQRQGRSVAMVGDGVNDAAALARADLGMAMGGGADSAIQSADIVVVRDDLAAVPQAIDLSRRTLRIIKQNLVWAFGYNIAALPLAVAGLLSPMVAGAAMALSSVLVVTNSLRLRGAFRQATPEADSTLD